MHREPKHAATQEYVRCAARYTCPVCSEAGAQSGTVPPSQYPLKFLYIKSAKSPCSGPRAWLLRVARLVRHKACRVCRGRYTLPVSCCCACACAGTAALSTPHSRRQNGVQIPTRLLSRNRAESPIGYFSDRVFVCISKSSLASQCRPVSNYNGETILLQAWFSHGALFKKRKSAPPGGAEAPYSLRIFNLQKLPHGKTRPEAKSSAHCKLLRGSYRPQTWQTSSA